MSDLTQVREEVSRLPSIISTKEEGDLLTQISSDFTAANNLRTRSWRHLSDRSLEDFWRISRDLYNGYVEPGGLAEDEWKSKTFKKKTRRKVIATAATLLASSIGLDFSAIDLEDSIDREMSKLTEDTYDWSLEREAWDMKQLRLLMQMIIYGTGCVYEEIAWDKREVKEIMDIDFSTGKIQWEKKERVDFKGPRATIVPIDEMYLGDAFTRDIQKQPFIIWRTVGTYEDLEKEFDRFEPWRHVLPGGAQFLPTTGDNTEQQEEDDTDEDDNAVEIIRYFDKRKDLYAVVANGVLLTDVDYPFPWPHKNYPFAWEIFEQFADIDFAWGNSVPFVSKDEQETINTLTRMFIDSVKLSNKPPLFTNSAELAGTDLIQPGLIGLKEQNEVVETIPEITKGVGNSEFNVLESEVKQMDENSLDPLVSGQQAEGNPTATEVNAVVGSAQRLQGYNQQFVGSILMQHARLRIPNALWFLTHDEDYTRVVRNDVKVRGSKGNRFIEFVDADKLPSPAEVLKSQTKLEITKGEFVEKVFVEKDSVNDYRFSVAVSPTPKPKRNSTSRFLQVIEKYQLYSQNELIDQVENTTDLVEAFGDEPERLVNNPEEPKDEAGREELMRGGAPPPGGGAPRQQPETLALPPQNPAQTAAIAGQEGAAPQPPTP